MQALQGCETSGKSFLSEEPSHGMHGEPGVHLETYSRSSSLASPVSIDSLCGFDYLTAPGSPDEHQSVSHMRRRQQNTVHLHGIELNTDPGLTVLCLLSLMLAVYRLPLRKICLQLQFAIIVKCSAFSKAVVFLLLVWKKIN